MAARNALINTIIGSALRDTLSGTADDDLIFGYGDGSGAGGLPPPLDPAGGGARDADTLIGNDGDDTIFGGGGNDTVRGGRGDDIIFGDDGADFLAGNDGRDIVSGGAGNDRIFGGWDEDSLAGDAGDDTISGGGLDDRIAGGEGDDTLDGGAGDDEIDGGPGDDTIEGGDGIDTVVLISDFFTDPFGFTDEAVTLHSGVITIEADEDGTDVLTGIEYLRSGDVVAALPTNASSIDIATLTSEQGFTIGDPDPLLPSGWTRLGVSVSSAGDVNGDGIDDVIIGTLGGEEGSRTYDGYEGGAYVVYGRTSGFGDRVELTALTDDQGFKIAGGVPEGNLGFSVSGAGDVNDDGFDDVVVNADSETYVIYGSGSRSGDVDVSTLAAAEGVAITGGTRSVSGAGDVNGDGIDDFVVADFDRSYLIFGSGGGLDTNIDLASLSPAQGVVIEGAGGEVSGAGDVNGDGFGDLIIIGESSYSGQSASLYVIFGTDQGLGPSIDPTAISPSQGFEMRSPGDVRDVSAAGDINGDGFDDVLIGTRSGLGYAVLGTDAEITSALDLANLDPSQGFAIRGVDYEYGAMSVGAAGDVNGDGLDDFIVAKSDSDSLLASRYNAGEAFVVFGRDDGFGDGLDVTTLTEEQGFVIYGEDRQGYLGTPVSSAGDIDGDGLDDVIVGAPLADLRAGESYVIFGRATGGAPNGPAATLDADDLLPAAEPSWAPGDSPSFAGAATLPTAGDPASAAREAEAAAAPDPGPLIAEAEIATLAA